MSGYPAVYNPVVANPNDGENITLCKILDGISVLSHAIGNGNLLPYTHISTASTNAIVVKASAGNVYNFIATNVSNQIKYVKFYDKATTPNPTTDSADYIIPLQNGQTIALALGVSPFIFHNGISFANTTSASGGGNVGAGDIVFSLSYA